MKENTGLDTETYQGLVKLICSDDGDYKEIESFDDCLKFLTRLKFKGKYNWFYNIQFDFESIVKYLDHAQLIELYQNKELQYNEFFKITYIPRKYFAIVDNHNHRYYFYDLYNFLDTSLDKASKKFLNDAKIDTIDGNKLNTDISYWNDNKEDIIKYCIKDANLTKRLADYFWNIIYSRLNFYPKSPMSKGKLSEEYFLHVCKVPTINSIPEKVIQTAYDSFYGGRFELLKRGYFPKVYCYDIMSAYPKQIAEQPDFSKGKFKKVFQLNEDAYTGFYKCKVFAVEENISPFKLKIGDSASGLNLYPNGQFIQYLAKEEIQFCKEHFPNAAIKIEYGYEWYPKSLVKPFKEEIERLYQWKATEQDPDIKYCVKIILNSLYGKFIQVAGDANNTGRLFNPLYAARITAATRLKIIELALQKENNIISFSTDSVMSTSPLKIPSNPTMGDFQQDFEGEGVFVLSDVYNLWNNDTKKSKTKLRGFSAASTKDTSSEVVYLKDILKTSDEWKDNKGVSTPEVYHYSSKRPYHLGECLIHTKTRSIKDINVFGVIMKSIDINGDNKRIWSDEFKNGKDCLKEQHDSNPIMVGV